MSNIIIQNTAEITSHLAKANIDVANAKIVIQEHNFLKTEIPVKEGYYVEINENKQMIPPALAISEGINEPVPVTARIIKDNWETGPTGNLVRMPPNTIWYNSGPMTRDDLEDMMVNILKLL